MRLHQVPGRGCDVGRRAHPAVCRRGATSAREGRPRGYGCPPILWGDLVSSHGHCARLRLQLYAHFSVRHILDAPLVAPCSAAKPISEAISEALSAAHGGLPGFKWSFV